MLAPKSFLIHTLFSTSVLATLTITPHSDGVCQKPLTDATYSDGAFTGMTVAKSINDATPYESWASVAFPGAEAEDGAGGYNVWWQIPEPDPECTVLVMRTSSVDRRDGNVLAGTIIIQADKAGCYYSNVPAGTTLYTTFCCGSGDCDKVALTPGLGFQDIALPAPSGAPKPRSISALNSRRIGRSFPRRASSMTKRDFVPSCGIPSTAPAKNCQVTKQSDKYRKAGRQMALSNAKTCDSVGECPETIEWAVTADTTLSTEHEQRLETSTGVTLSFTTGVDILGEKAEVEAGFEESISKAWSDSTGTEIAHGKEVHVQDTLPVHPGTTGILTFVPFLECWKAYMNCGKDDTTDELEFCQPPDDHRSGEYVVVYTQ